MQALSYRAMSSRGKTGNKPYHSVLVLPSAWGASITKTAACACGHLPGTRGTQGPGVWKTDWWLCERTWVLGNIATVALDLAIFLTSVQTLGSLWMSLQIKCMNLWSLPLLEGPVCLDPTHAFPLAAAPFWFSGLLHAGVLPFM